MGSWIDLAQFATKYGISQSTLRRRIRANTIPYKLERGKYFLKDSPEILSEAPLFARNVNQPLNTPASQRALSSGFDNVATNHDNSALVQALEDENRKLTKQLAEVETFVSALEAEIRRLQNTNPVRNEFSAADAI